MGQRNILCTHQMLDLEIDQGQIHRLNPEPCFLLGNLVDFPNTNIQQVFSASGPTPSLDLRHLPDHHDSSIFYSNPYGSLQHRHPDLGGSTVNFSYNPYMVSSSSSRIGSVPINHGSSDLASSSSHGLSGVNLDEYGRGDHMMDNSRGSCKRKNAEGIPGNHYYVNGPAGSSSSSSLCGPLSSGLPPWEEQFEPTVGMMEATLPFNALEYRGHGVMPISEGGSQRSVRSRSSTINLQLDSVLAHHNNQIVQGNHMGRPFLPASNTWVEQFGNNSGDTGSANWHYAPPVPYLHGRNVNGGPLEVGSVNGRGFQDPASSRNPGVLIHPLPMHHHRGQHSSTVQGMRGGHNFSYNAQVPVPSYRHPANYLHPGTLNASRDGLEAPGTRYPRTLPLSGDRIYRPQRRMPQMAQESINDHIRLLSSEDVAILEFSGFYGAGNFVDQHRDMRLDIDDMSYEELLALEERIGDVSTGLSEESIAKCLKTRIHCSSSSSAPGLPEGMDQEHGTCIICQVEYEENEKVGALDCGHDYHADCIKQWLLVKNVCPICKTSALPMDEKEG
ncbi:hypothetical protein H6P81_012938 [Aristolochia fimbriata]|uniref:RING-type E3 ubiquitin transferase n=1 Tax=Aristolochia fimbriata TaxID=158543 RepID=A0AAV7EDA0_ARIFI|nr:hypothetical protein H6P81_012938 [Aristolochia fimbriata]